MPSGECANLAGTGLYLTAAMANHSCNPSCAQTFNGSELKFRALRPLSEGEEVTIAYIEMAATRQERRLTLQESYFFDIDEYGSVPGPLPVVRSGCQEQGSASSNSPGSAMNTMELATGITVRLLSEQEAGFRSDPVDSELTQMCGTATPLIYICVVQCGTCDIDCPGILLTFIWAPVVKGFCHLLPLIRSFWKPQDAWQT